MSTYFVNNVTGDDGNDGSTEELAFATIQKGIDQLELDGGGIVYVKKTGTDYMLTVNLLVDVAMTSWSPGEYALVEGYEVTPGDGEKPTIDKVGAVNYLLHINLPSTYAYWIFRSLIFDGSDNIQIYANCYCGRFDHLECKNSGSSGIYSQGYCQMYSCHIHDSVGNGFHSFSLGNHVVNCFSANNAQGFYDRQGGDYQQCIAYHNSNDGFAAGGTFVSCIDCISYDNGAAGFDSNRWCTLVNCDASENTGIGFDRSHNIYPGWIIGCNAYNNGGGNYNANADTVKHDCTELDPEFNDPAAGDFRPGANLINRGVPSEIIPMPGVADVSVGSMDIGTIQASFPSAAGKISSRAFPSLGVLGVGR